MRFCRDAVVSSFITFASVLDTLFTFSLELTPSPCKTEMDATTLFLDKFCAARSDNCSCTRAFWPFRCFIFCTKAFTLSSMRVQIYCRKVANLSRTIVSMNLRKLERATSQVLLTLAFSTLRTAGSLSFICVWQYLSAFGIAAVHSFVMRVQVWTVTSVAERRLLRRLYPFSNILCISSFSMRENSLLDKKQRKE